jgi:hypothetical protein
LPGYLDQKHRKDFVYYKTILEYFGTDSRKAGHEYRNFVREGLTKDMPNPLEKGKGHGIVGEEDFVDEIKQLYSRDQKEMKLKREQPALRGLGKAVHPGELIDAYAKLVDKSREELTAKGKQSTERAMLMDLLYRLCKTTQPVIGELLGGIDYSTVSQARKRLQARLESDPELSKKYKDLRQTLSQMSRVKI